MTLVFKAQETTWSYEQSFYFSFITMTTIGFGDYVPAQVIYEPRGKFEGGTDQIRKYWSGTGPSLADNQSHGLNKEF